PTAVRPRRACGDARGPVEPRVDLPTPGVAVEGDDLAARRPAWPEPVDPLWRDVGEGHRHSPTVRHRPRFGQATRGSGRRPRSSCRPAVWGDELVSAAV